MGVAYTDHPVIYKTLRSHTAAELLADLDAALTSVGWVGASITGGHKYTIASPQGLQCKVKIYDDGTRVIVQFVSVDETLTGLAHKLAYGVSEYEAYGYELVANQCQMFVALRGITNQNLNIFIDRDYAVAGGIPYVAAPVDPECVASAGPNSAVSRIFWSCGQTDSNGFQDFRSGRFCQAGYSYCLNGAVTIVDAAANRNPYNGALQLYPLTLTEDADLGYAVQPRTVKYSSGDPLYLHPFIGWEFAIQGQLWDAFMVSRDTVLDDVLMTTETDAGGNTLRCTWLGWNYGLALGTGRGGAGTYFATLYLLTSKMTKGVWNYAY